MPTRLIPLREVDVPQALQYIVESQEWSPRAQPWLDPREVLGAPNCIWMSALNGDELLGIVGYTGVSWPDGCADVALGVVPKWRGKGIAKELAKIQNAYAFQDLGLRRLQMFALKDSPSCKIARAAGLTLEGTLKGCRLKRGVYHDAEIHALLKGA